MSDDLVSDLRQQARNRAERMGGGYEATVEWRAAAEIERLRIIFGEFKQNAERHDERLSGQIKTLVGQKTYWMDRLTLAESELSTLRDILVLCGELGGMGKDETPVDYLRRLIDEVAGVESLRARVREVVGPFARLDTSHTDDIDDSALVFENEGGNIVLGHLRAACQLMEDLK